MSNTTSSTSIGQGAAVASAPTPVTPPRPTSSSINRSPTTDSNSHHNNDRDQAVENNKPLQLGFSLSHLRRTLSALKEAVDDHDYHSSRRSRAALALATGTDGVAGRHDRDRHRNRRRRNRDRERRRQQHRQQQHRRRQQHEVRRNHNARGAARRQDNDDDDNDIQQQRENRDVEFFEVDSEDEEVDRLNQRIDRHGFNNRRHNHHNGDSSDEEDDDNEEEEEEEDDGLDVEHVDVHQQVTSTTEALQDAAIAIAKASMVSIMSLTLKEKEQHSIRRYQHRQQRRYSRHAQGDVRRSVHSSSNKSSIASSSGSESFPTDTTTTNNNVSFHAIMKQNDMIPSTSYYSLPSSSPSSSVKSSSSSSFLLQLPWKQRHGMMHDLREIFDTVVHTRRTQTVEFYTLWREWVLQLLTSDHCRELQLFGWEQLEELVRASAKHRPPPRSYVVEGAGVDFVNGEYTYAGKLTPDGYAYTSAGLDGVGWRSNGRSFGYGAGGGDDMDQLLDDDLAMDDPTAPHYASTLAALSNSCSRHSYERVAVVPRRRDQDDNDEDDEDESSTTGGNQRRQQQQEDEMEEKKITLFQCTMQSKQKWWFLSEADEEQPGTDRDIDYYEHSRSWRTSARRQRNGRPSNAAAAARQRMLRRLADEDVSAFGDVQYQDDLPPTQHWKTSKDGVGSAPTLRRVGYMVPRGEETNTLEHQLAQWMLQEDVLNIAIRQSRQCEQVANHYLPLVMKFSATIFELESGDTDFASTGKGTQLIVQLSQWYLMRNNESKNEAGNNATSTGNARTMKKQGSCSSLSTNSTRSETSFSSTRMQDDDEEFIAMMNRPNNNGGVKAVDALPHDIPLDKEGLRRLNAIADWLSDDVLLYPKEEDVQKYAKLFMSVGLDSVDTILEDLTVEDLDSMVEFDALKTFHKRRIRQHLLERSS